MKGPLAGTAGFLLAAGMVTVPFGGTAPAHASAAAQAGVPPSAPFLANVVAEGLGAQVSWTPNPAADQVTGYTIMAAVDPHFTKPVTPACAAPPAVSVPPSDSSALATGLCPRVPYLMTVTATNASGTSPASNASNPVVPLPAQPPSSPLITTVLARSGSLVVEWAPPAILGGDPLKGYSLSATAGSQTVTVHPSASATRATITGLTDSTLYQLSLSALSRAGASSPVLESGTPAAAYVPGQPLSLQVVPNGSGGLVATWSAPSDDGGSPITKYVLDVQREVPTKSGWTPKGTARSLHVSGRTTTAVLTNVAAQRFYSVSVAAVSAAGTGAPSTTANPVTPTSAVGQNTVILTSGTMNALGSDNGGTLTWAAPAPAQVQSITTGQVLVGPSADAAPDGLLVKVLSVSVDGSGNYVVQTAPARLSDAFQDLSLSQIGDPSGLAGATFQPAMAGVSLIDPGPRISISPNFSIGLSISTGSLKAAGTLSINPTFEFDWQIHQGFLGIPDGITAAASASVKVAASASVTMNTSSLVPGGHWLLGELRTEPIDIQIGPVPVVLDPQIPVFLNATGSISFAISVSTLVGASLEWNSDDPGTLNASNLSKPPEVHGGPLPGVAATASGGLTLSFFPEIAIYGVTGPDMELDAQLQASANYNPPAGTPYFQIGPSLALKAGWYLDLSLGPFSLESQLSVTLATLTFAAYEIQQPPNADLVVGPSNPAVKARAQITFSATRSDGTFQLPIVWSLVDPVAGDSISSTGVLTAAKPGGRTLTVQAVDSTGATGRTDVTVQGAPDPPTGVTATSDGNGTTAAVAWTAPANTGGSPIASYVVVTEPPTATHTLAPSATSVEITTLQLNTSYTVAVYAQNTGGLTSDPASVALQTPAPGAVTAAAAIEAPLPANAANPPPPNLPASTVDGISCPRTGACVAVGGYGDNPNFSDDLGLIDTLSNGAWTPLQAPLPSNVVVTQSTDAILLAVACPALGTCVSVGDYGGPAVDGGTGAVIDTLSGGTWTALQAPLPANADPVYSPNLSALSCPAPGSCTAVGSYYDAHEHQHSLIERLRNGAWTAKEAPVPANAHTVPNSIANGLVGLGGVACPSTETCTAIGTYYDSAGSYEGLIETLSNGAWTPFEAPVPADANAVPNASLASGGGTALSCPTSAFCVAIGDYSDVNSTAQGLIETFSNGTWTAVQAPLLSGSNEAAVLAVDCVLPGSCVAVGNQSTTGYPQASTETLSNGTWSPAAAPVPHNAGTTGASLNAIVCRSDGSCVAGGNYNDRRGYSEGLFESLSSGTWTSFEAPAPAGSSTTPDESFASGLSFDGTGTCIALGSYMDSSDQIKGAISTFTIAGSG